MRDRTSVVSLGRNMCSPRHKDFPFGWNKRCRRHGKCHTGRSMHPRKWEIDRGNPSLRPWRKGAASHDGVLRLDLPGIAQLSSVNSRHSLLRRHICVRQIQGHHPHICRSLGTNSRTAPPRGCCDRSLPNQASPLGNTGTPAIPGPG